MRVSRGDTDLTIDVDRSRQSARASAAALDSLSAFLFGVASEIEADETFIGSSELSVVDIY